MKEKRAKRALHGYNNQQGLARKGQNNVKKGSRYRAMRLNRLGPEKCKI